MSFQFNAYLEEKVGEMYYFECMNGKGEYFHAGISLCMKIKFNINYYYDITLSYFEQEEEYIRVDKIEGVNFIDIDKDIYIKIKINFEETFNAREKVAQLSKKNNKIENIKEKLMNIYLDNDNIELKNEWEYINENRRLEKKIKSIISNSENINNYGNTMYDQLEEVVKRIIPIAVKKNKDNISGLLDIIVKVYSNNSENEYEYIKYISELLSYKGIGINSISKLLSIVKSNLFMSYSQYLYEYLILCEFINVEDRNRNIMKNRVKSINNNFEVTKFYLDYIKSINNILKSFDRFFNKVEGNRIGVNCYIAKKIDLVELGLY